MKNQNNMSLQKISTPTVMFPEENNLDDTRDNELKIAILDTFKELEEHMNKYRMMV